MPVHAAQSHLEEITQQLRAGGGTCVLCGVERAYEVLAYAPAGMERHVVVLSDGQARYASLDQRTRRGLREQRITTTTIGLGRDVDYKTLSAMSRGGAGRYYFIRNSQSIPTVLEAELAQVKSAAVSELKLHVDLEGATLDRSHPNALPLDTLTVPRMAHNARRRFLVPLVLQPGAPGAVIRVRAVYNHADGESDLGALGRSVIADDIDDVPRARNWLVTAEAARLGTNHIVRQALDACEAHEMSKGRRMLEGQLALLRTIEEQLPGDHVAWQRREVERVLGELETYTPGSLALRGANLNQVAQGWYANPLNSSASADAESGEMAVTPVFLDDMDCELE